MHKLRNTRTRIDTLIDTNGDSVEDRVIEMPAQVILTCVMCGRKNPDESCFCNGCGKKLQNL